MPIDIVPGVTTSAVTDGVGDDGDDGDDGDCE